MTNNFKAVKGVFPVKTSNGNVSFFSQNFLLCYNTYLNLYLLINYKIKIKLLNYAILLLIFHFQL